jgi:hypothetical protein
MAKTYGGGFSRPKRPDCITEELATVLSENTSFEFKALFDIVHANLRVKNSANGGEEMLRLKAYERLQGLVSKGMVKRTLIAGGKEYRGLASLSSALPVKEAPINGNS